MAKLRYDFEHSTAVRTLEFDLGGGTLDVIYASGTKAYTYSMNKPGNDIRSRLMGAESLGRELNLCIKDNSLTPIH